MNTDNRISALVITFNEIDNIERCIQSIAFADEIIVVDSFSTDGTWEFLQSKNNIRAFQHIFENFTQQKTYALSLATHDWIYFIDADEKITEPLQKEIRSKIINSNNISTFWNYRVFMFLGKPIRFGGYQNDKVQRLFRKSQCYFDPHRTVHEKLIVEGAEGILKHKLLHYCYQSFSDYKQKTISYGRMSALDRYQTGARFHWSLMILKSGWKFISKLVFKLGFLDGKKGVILAYLSALGVLERYKELMKIRMPSSTHKNLKIGYEAKRIFHNKSGLGNYSRNLIYGLSKNSPNHSFYLYNPKESSEILFKPNNTNVFERRPQSNFCKTYYNWWRQKAVVNDLVKDGIDIFHGLSGELPWGLKKTNIKSVVTIHDLIFLRKPQWYSLIDRTIYNFKFKKAAKNADLIVAVSEQTKKDIMTFYGIESSKIKIIYQGCHSIFRQRFTKEDCQKTLSKYQIPKKFILNVGTVEKRKNVLLAVKAIKDLNVSLVIVGKKTSYAKVVENYIVKHGLEKQVFFLKGVDLKELAILYQSAELFVYPSLYEGFGIPIIEALTSKTPVITSRGGVFSEVGGNYSIYVDPHDSDELKSQITRLLNHPQHCQKMIEEGIKYVQKFEKSSLTKTMNDVYINLVGKK